MPAAICYLYIILLDFKVSITGELKQGMQNQSQYSPQPNGVNPRYPAQTRVTCLSDHGQYLEGKDCASLSCCWNSLKQYVAIFCALS